MELNSRHLPNITVTSEEPLFINWDKARKPLMDIEKKCFHPDIQEDFKGKKHLIMHSDSVSFAYDKNKIIGEIYALDTYQSHGNTDDDDHMNQVMKDVKQSESLYVYSGAILPKYWGMDITKRMFMKILIDAKRTMRSSLVCHARHGASLHLAQFFEGEVLTDRPNWFNTGNTYSLCSIDVSKIHLCDVRPYKQLYDYDCGISAIETLFDAKGLHYPRQTLFDLDNCSPGDGTEPEGLIDIIEGNGFKPVILDCLDDLFLELSCRRPCIICCLCPGTYEGHYLVAMGFGKNSVYVMNPEYGNFGRMSFDELGRVWWNNITQDRWGCSIL